MFVRKPVHQTRETKFAPVVMPAPTATEIMPSDDERSKAELRRQMYERIARGNALAEAEEHAHRMWNGR